MRLVDINGNPYTSANEDLDLLKIKSALQKCLHSGIQRALLTHREGDLNIDLHEAFAYFEIVYALGRAREGDKREPTKVERKRFERILGIMLQRLSAQVWEAATATADGRAELQLAPVIELVDQAYYAGREDGAR